MKQRNVFITFLGTNPYIECNYVLDDRKITSVRFVQEALVRLLCADYHEPDQILVFLTDQARTKNWLDTNHDGQQVEGLKRRLDAIVKEALVKPITIPNGRSSDELWDIFGLIFAQIKDSDRIILDITHAFRSLPMLGMVLLNYARLLKNITIDGIYYGAFEVLGTTAEVEKMELTERNAPIFKLSDFSTLLEWSSGVQEFVRHGNPAAIAELLEREAKPRMKESRGNDQFAKKWRGAALCLREIGGQITTNRGQELFKGAAVMKLRSYLDDCKSLPVLPPPFRPLIEQIERKISSFKEDDLDNCLRAVEWCLKHDLVQQGLTMLQEGIISIIAQRHDLDWRSREDRETVSDAINVMNQKIEKAEWKESLKGKEDTVAAIHDDPLSGAIAPAFDSLSKTRNDINHGGFVESLPAEKLREKFRKIYEKISAVLEK